MVNPDGSLDDREVPNIARTILQRTAGHLLKMSYRVETGHFSGLYEATPGGTSVLYLSKNRVYKNGYTVNVYPRDQVKLTEEVNYVYITYTGNEPRQILVTVDKL